MTKAELLQKVGERLGYYGYDDVIGIDRGRLTIELQFERGEHTLTIVERELYDEKVSNPKRRVMRERRPYAR